MNPETRSTDEKSARRAEEEERSLSGSESGSGSDSGSEEEDDEDEDESEDEDDTSEVNIDLSENEFYKGMCTLLEDENGNNIVAYMDLIHDETKNIADSVKHLEGMRKDMRRIADCFERLLALHEAKATGGAVAPAPSSSSHRHSAEDEKSVRTSKSSKSRRE
jgi:hypothetical protein